MLCALDRGTRKLSVRALKSKTVEETLAALTDILAKANATDTIKEMSMDSASEFLSQPMQNFLKRIGPNEGGVVTHVKAPDRASRQDISDLDSKMGIFSRQLNLLRSEAEPDTLAWYPFVEKAVEFTNKKRIRTGRAMGVAPNKAQESFAAAGRPSAACPKPAFCRKTVVKPAF